MPTSRWLHLIKNFSIFFCHRLCQSLDTADLQLIWMNPNLHVFLSFTIFDPKEFDHKPSSNSSPIFTPEKSKFRITTISSIWSGIFRGFKNFHNLVLLNPEKAYILNFQVWLLWISLVTGCGGVNDESSLGEQKGEKVGTLER